MSVIALNVSCLSAADVAAVRPHIMSLIRRGIAERWDLDMSLDGYAAITVQGSGGRVLFAITKQHGAYCVANAAGRPVLESRRLSDVLAVLS
ncbi:MAG: hypothetical protein EA406_06425 [Rhodospirillales bacterium]|nr:MAG: hypothetical protein EA406_06425 [Rhodospirillales bacterium]